MHVTVFSRPENPEAAGFARGVESHGDRILWQRPSVWGEDQYVPTDAAMIRGCHAESRRILSYVHSRGIPVIVSDLPAVRWESEVDGGRLPEYGFWLHWINRLAPLDDGLRYKRLLPRRLPHDRQGSVLVCGQKPYDAAHGMDGSEIVRWARGAIDQARESSGGAEVVWRPHPSAPELDPGNQDATSNPRERGLLDELYRSRLVVVYNSTAGITALRLGIPVRCHRSCFYLDLISPLHEVSERHRHRLCQTLSPHQWTTPDLAGGAMWELWRPLIESEIHQAA